ncbi:hypothetical protein ACFYKX_25525 [Cytobacillus sp. FJAT-54145]|uniref:Uncharacterized protein n=1 Tax=Cytobacillus spartinae TaxID=3299023 RepID=A0ABW6KMH6_9BACI
MTYWRPDLAILDSKFEFYEETRDLFFRFNKDVIEFTSDFESVLDEVATYSAFYESEVEEEEQEQTIEKEVPDFTEYKNKLKEFPPMEREVVVEVRKEIIEKEVERISYTNVPSKLIVVASLWSGAGSTFIGTNLARAVSNRGVQVSYIEYPTMTPYMFDYINITLREEIDKFQYIDLAKAITTKGIIPRGRAWIDKGVQWVLNDPRTPRVSEWNFEKMLKLIYSLSSPIVIVDISTIWEEEHVKGLLHQADHIFLCIEPDVAKINCLADKRKESKFFEYLQNVKEEENIPFDLIVTKMNDGVKRSEWCSALPIKPIAEFEYIPYSTLCKSLWKSEFLYDDEGFIDEFETNYSPILKVLLPPKFHHLESKPKKGIGLSAIINRFKK